MPGEPVSDSRTHAAIEIVGAALRYAEVELSPRARDLDAPPSALPGPRLLRMGACDFEFDAGVAILDPAGPTHLETVSSAVAEIFSGSQATRLCVAVHPWQATSFFSLLPAGMAPSEKVEQLRQEAAMLADARHGRTVRISATPVRRETRPDGQPFHWHHVLRLSEAVHARVDHLAGRIGAEVDYAFVDATGAAAAVASQLRTEQELFQEQDDPDSIPFSMVLGGYGRRIEMALARGSTWYFGNWAEVVAPGDGAYFAAALLERLGLQAAHVRQLFTYGGTTHGAIEGIESLFATKAVPLNPLGLFRLVRSQADSSALAAFAPCVGACLRG